MNHISTFHQSLKSVLKSPSQKKTETHSMSGSRRESGKVGRITGKHLWPIFQHRRQLDHARASLCQCPCHRPQRSTPQCHPRRHRHGQARLEQRAWARMALKRRSSAVLQAFWRTPGRGRETGLQWQRRPPVSIIRKQPLYVSVGKNLHCESVYPGCAPGQSSVRCAWPPTALARRR